MVFIRYLYSVRNFAKKFSSSNCGSLLGVEIFIIFFADLRMYLGLLEYFNLLASVYDPNIVWFCMFYFSSTLKKVLENFFQSSSYLILAQSLAPFSCLFSNWQSSSCKFSTIGLISGMKFSFLYEFCSLLSVLIFSWVAEYLEKVLAFFLN